MNDERVSRGNSHFLSYALLCVCLGLFFSLNTYASCTNLFSLKQVREDVESEVRWMGPGTGFDYASLLQVIDPYIRSATGTTRTTESKAYAFVFSAVQRFLAQIESNTGPDFVYRSIPFNIIGFLRRTFVPHRLSEFGKRAENKKTRTGWGGQTREGESPLEYLEGESERPQVETSGDHVTSLLALQYALAKIYRRYPGRHAHHHALRLAFLKGRSRVEIEKIGYQGKRLNGPTVWRQLIKGREEIAEVLTLLGYGGKGTIEDIHELRQNKLAFCLLLALIERSRARKPSEIAIYRILREHVINGKSASEIAQEKNIKVEAVAELIRGEKMRKFRQYADIEFPGYVAEPGRFETHEIALDILYDALIYLEGYSEVWAKRAQALQRLICDDRDGASVAAELGLNPRNIRADVDRTKNRLVDQEIFARYSVSVEDLKLDGPIERTLDAKRGVALALAWISKERSSTDPMARTSMRLYLSERFEPHEIMKTDEWLAFSIPKGKTPHRLIEELVKKHEEAASKIDVSDFIEVNGIQGTRELAVSLIQAGLEKVSIGGKGGSGERRAYVLRQHLFRGLTDSEISEEGYQGESIASGTVFGLIASGKKQITDFITGAERLTVYKSRLSERSIDDPVAGAALALGWVTSGNWTKNSTNRIALRLHIGNQLDMAEIPDHEEWRSRSYKARTKVPPSEIISQTIKMNREKVEGLSLGEFVSSSRARSTKQLALKITEAAIHRLRETHPQARIGEKKAEILRRHIIEGETREKIAREGVDGNPLPPNQVKSHLTTGKARLAEIIKNGDFLR